MDCVLVSASSSAKAFQGLADKYAAIETPTWALLLAEASRKKGFNVKALTYYNSFNSWGWLDHINQKV